ncbi:DUF3099 domain-containing protein [Microbacterium sp. 4R-513]|uniref:DUF3099 domain-containing protein n=1 Tax=Microbacterium sp. 4R-513 TaxID=2567934 RepID=UPI001F493F4E|nr:DUF3099 domain-containing protein [Microbacterium sp. 4R-513]
MKNSSGAQSATSLPQAPRDEVGARSTRYLITMGIRVACFILMVVITPYSWYTWIFAAGAVFLPYIAVVMANVGEDGRRVRREAPERALPSATPALPREENPRVIRLEEQRPLAASSDDGVPRHPSDLSDPEQGSSA